MDTIQGVKQKLNGFRKFLELHPEWVDDVTLVQISIPTKNINAQNKVTDLIAKINGTFGSLESVPIHHYYHSLEPEDYYALLCTADLALITPLRDGMNTTCHDFVACQKENHGILIVSEFTGTAGAMAGLTRLI